MWVTLDLHREQTQRIGTDLLKSLDGLAAWLAPQPVRASCNGWRASSPVCLFNCVASKHHIEAEQGRNTAGKSGYGGLLEPLGVARPALEAVLVSLAGRRVRPCKPRCYALRGGH